MLFKVQSILTTALSELMFENEKDKTLECPTFALSKIGAII